MTVSPVVKTPAKSGPPSGWNDQYRGNPGHWDEAVDAAGTVRPAWERLIETLRGMPVEQVQRQHELCRQLLLDYGVTYNLPGGSSTEDRPWRLDSCPLILPADEWHHLSRAVAQRARLLNALLADIYGPGELIAEGSLPPELIFANPAFLRAAHGIHPPRDTYLNFYAVDVARSPNGVWWVTGDRTDNPAGVGYALENRIVLGRMYPELIRDYYVERLARFFMQLRDGLIALAPRATDVPRVVILTPGHFQATYFEHAYLARYLGFNLVESSDLTVRDRRVYLKTLSGLLPVDVILRRVDSDYCDPLELRDDSLLGVPGLLQAVRAGNVAVANSIGSGVVESPALMPFLPGLCRRVLDEELALPSIATWWCGQRSALETVITQLDRLVIKPAYALRDSQPLLPGEQSETARAELVARIESAPHRWVGQEFVAVSTVPSWNGERFHPQHVVLRLYAVATGDGQYAVMPGGLARESSFAESVLVGTQTRGGGSKDTWVLAERPPEAISLLPTGSRTAALSRAGFILPSRLADNLFWLGRYLERLEFGCRIARCLLHRLADYAEFGQIGQLQFLVALLGGHGRIAAADETHEKLAPAELEKLVQQAIFARGNGFSLASDVERIHRLGVAVRERLSNDSWRLLLSLEECFAPPGRGQRADWELAAMDLCLARLAALAGQSMDGMTRDKGWLFLEMGRRLERAADMADLLRFGLYETADDESAKLSALLETANSRMTYRSRYVFGPDPAPVLDLMLADEANPRSIAFQLAHLQRYVREVNDARSGRSPEDDKVLAIWSTVRLADVDALARATEDGCREHLAGLLWDVRRAMDDLSQILTRAYLTHVQSTRPLQGPGT